MRKISRRGFLKQIALTAGTALLMPEIVPSSALGKDGAIAPSNRIVLASIGCGNRGLLDLSHFLEEKEVQCVAVCDCWAERRNQGKIMVDDYYGSKDCKTYRYYEDILSRADIDAVLVATGDRWHTPMSIFAARAGKDVYCEKPFTLTIAEGRTLVETMKRYGTIWQCGTQRRSNASFRFVAEAVRDGMIGKLKTITTSFGGWSGSGFATPEPEPEGFDYDRWLGQAPWAPYSSVRVKWWRNNWNTSAGPIVDMGPHYFDIAQWACDTEMSGPVEFEGEGEFPGDGFANVPFKVNVRVRYAGGVLIVMDSGEKGMRFEGDEGWIYIDDFGNIAAEPKSILQNNSASGFSYQYMAGHIGNFLECMRSRKPTASYPEISQRSHTIAHCANICLRLGRKVYWNSDTERFVNDEDANNMLSRTMRIPWGI